MFPIDMCAPPAQTERARGAAPDGPGGAWARRQEAAVFIALKGQHPVLLRRAHVRTCLLRFIPSTPPSVTIFQHLSTSLPFPVCVSVSIWLSLHPVYT